MTIQTKRKWILLLAVLLLAAALSVGSTSLWKAEKEKRGEGYVAVVRIDGAIYGGPETDSMLSGSSGSSSEEIMRELQEARKDPWVICAPRQATGWRARGITFSPLRPP